MGSRINIGPEDGPYVAINESSGNLQLEDNSGNVVAEWDEANAQWDFANNTLSNVDALNSNSVNTDELTTEKSATVAYNSSTQTVEDDTFTKLQYGSVEFDQLDAWDTDNYKFVAPSAGTYEFRSAVRFDDDVQGRIFIDAHLNDSRLERFRFIKSIIDGDGEDLEFKQQSVLHGTDGIVKLEEGDELDWRLRHETGSSVDIRADSASHIMVRRV